MNNGSIHLLKLNKAVPEKINQELEKVKLKIMKNEIKVVDIPIAADLHKYLKKQFPR